MAVYLIHLTAAGYHILYGITQCHLAVVIFPPFTQLKLVLSLVMPEGCSFASGALQCLANC